MKITELVKHTEFKQPDFTRFLRSNRRAGLPPLDVAALRINELIEEQRALIKTPTNGDVTFLLQYKGHDGGVISLDEIEDGDIWDIGQVQGARSRKSYRVNSGMYWQNAIATRIWDYAKAEDADVRHITMPALCGIDNICEAVSENVDRLYLAVASQLGMRFSDDLGLYVVDTPRSK